MILARRICGRLEAGEYSFKIRQLHEADKAIIDRFFSEETQQDDLVYTGIESKRFNFRHPCYSHFGIFAGEQLAALGWVKVLGRNSVERIILIGRSWRRRGLRSAWHARNNSLCQRMGLVTVTRINENNKLMLDIYRNKGFSLDRKEGHLYIIEECPFYFQGRRCERGLSDL